MQCRFCHKWLLPLAVEQHQQSSTWCLQAQGKAVDMLQCQRCSRKTASGWAMVQHYHSRHAEFLEDLHKMQIDVDWQYPPSHNTALKPRRSPSRSMARPVGGSPQRPRSPPNPPKRRPKHPPGPREKPKPLPLKEVAVKQESEPEVARQAAKQDQDTKPNKNNATEGQGTASLATVDTGGTPHRASASGVLIAIGQALASER